MFVRRIARKALACGTALAAVLTGLVVVQAAPAAASIGPIHGCPANYLCIYPGDGWNGDHPSVKYYPYYAPGINHGEYNVYGLYGVHLVLNNTTCGPIWFNSGKNGGGYHLVIGQHDSYDPNLTPYNSITFWIDTNLCWGS
ncbi:hypothetical protein ACQPYH_01320 [Kribbella sp. CA-245084]|uniref:hypothetical protein n=1 Tax=Kribbella sp. CA-245084 TaxID=3239940 RepID=UPI003D946FD2